MLHQLYLHTLSFSLVYNHLSLLVLILCFPLFLAMAQSYSVLTGDAHVMLGNSVSLSCSVPGHLAPWVTITGWVLGERGREPLELGRSHHVYNGQGSLV